MRWQTHLQREAHEAVCRAQNSGNRHEELRHLKDLLNLEQTLSRSRRRSAWLRDKVSCLSKELGTSLGSNAPHRGDLPGNGDRDLASRPIVEDRVLESLCNGPCNVL